MRRTLGIMLIAGLLAACGGDDDATDIGEMFDAMNDAGPCSELYVEGQSVATILDDLCTEDGDLVAVALLQYDCADGRAFVYGGYGWGFIDGTWNASEDFTLGFDDAGNFTTPAGDVICEPS